MAVLHLIVLFVSLFGSPVNAVNADPLYFFSGTKEKFISNSTYSSNLNLLFTSLSSNASAAAGFATTTTGRVPDRVYGLTLCRGDTDTATCRSCINTAVSGIQLLCPNCMDAIIWYDNCQLCYSNQDFLHAPNITSDVQILMFNIQNVSADQLFRFEVLTTALMGNIRSRREKHIAAVRNRIDVVHGGEHYIRTGSVHEGPIRRGLQEMPAGDGGYDHQGTSERKDGRKGVWTMVQYEI